MTNGSLGLEGTEQWEINVIMFRDLTEAPKIPAHLQCPCISKEMKMSPEDHSICPGPESPPRVFYTSDTGLRRTPGEERMTLITQAPWLGMKSQVGSRAYKGQPPKAPTTGSSAQTGRVFKR